MRSGELRRGKERLRTALGDNADNPRFGETLLVDDLLEGSVRREGDRVRFTAWLVNASSEIHLWTDVYERHLTDCLSVQADVAARIAGSLASELIPEQPIVRSAG